MSIKKISEKIRQLTPKAKRVADNIDATRLIPPAAFLCATLLVAALGASGINKSGQNRKETAESEPAHYDAAATFQDTSPDRLRVYGAETAEYVMYSPFTPPDGDVAEFHSYINFPRGLSMEPYNGVPPDSRETELRMRLEQAVAEDENIGRPKTKQGEVIFKDGMEEDLSFSIKSFTEPSVKESRYSYTLEVDVKDENDFGASRELLLTGFNMNNTCFPCEPQRIALKKDESATLRVAWTSEQLRQAGIRHMSEVYITGIYGTAADEEDQPFYARIPVYSDTDAYDDVWTNNMSLHAEREAYTVIDSNYLTVDLYDFETVPGYGYRVQAYVSTKNYSPELAIALDLETNLTQSENPEIMKGQPDVKMQLAPNSTYRFTIYSPCTLEGAERGAVAYLRVRAELAFDMQNIDDLIARYDELSELDQTAVSMCMAYPAGVPMVSVTELVDMDATRAYPIDRPAA